MPHPKSVPECEWELPIRTNEVFGESIFFLPNIFKKKKKNRVSKEQQTGFSLIASLFCLKASQISTWRSACKYTKTGKRLGVRETVTYTQLAPSFGCSLILSGDAFGWMFWRYMLPRGKTSGCGKERAAILQKGGPLCPGMPLFTSQAKDLPWEAKE